MISGFYRSVDEICALFLDFTQCRMLFSYWHFRTSQSHHHRSSNLRSMLGTLRYASSMRSEVLLTFFSDCLTLEGGSHSFSRNVSSGVESLTAQISNAESMIFGMFQSATSCPCL